MYLKENSHVVLLNFYSQHLANQAATMNSLNASRKAKARIF